MPELPVLLALVFGVAVLYASVGHGGASGYLAAMALLGAAPASMKPTALVLNILVAGTGCVRYVRAGQFRWQALWPFALGALPMAFVGGGTATSEKVYKYVLGVVLVVAAVSLIVRARTTEERTRPLPVIPAVGIGSAIGFISGLIGVGGGIFLSPLLILSRWATPKETLGISSAFIFLNSISGLAGNLSSLGKLPPETPILALGAFGGGLMGSWLGSRRFAPRELCWMLSGVLGLAALKLLTP